MPQFYYTAKNKDKESEVSDIARASSKKELAKDLREEGLFLMSAEEIKDGGISLFSKKISLKDKIFLARNLQMMLSGGLSLSRSLRVISLQTKNSKLRDILLNVREDIHKGNSFSQALSSYPEVFSKMFRSIIKLSEETGKIEENLDIIINQFKKEYELKSKVKGALIYPSVIVVAMVAVGIAMLVFVVPKLADTFQSMNLDLPLPTRFFIALGSLLASNWYFIPFIFLGLFFAFKLIKKTKSGKRALDYTFLKIPVISTVVKKTNSARMARTLNSLLSSGISIVKSLEILAEGISNVYFKESILDAVESVKKGDKLSEALKPHAELYSFLMIQMIEVGEETGKTSEVLSETAEFLEEEVYSSMKNLTSVIEPALMILIGAAVGFFAISMLMPIYSLLEAL